MTVKQIKQNIGSQLVTTRADKQKSANQTYQAALANSAYTLAAPYVKVNPYNTSPLTALVIFQTDQAAKVTYTVVGKTANTSITNQVNGGYSTKHQVPLVGLYSGNNTVNLQLTYADGTTATKTLTIKTTTQLPKYLRQTKIKVTKNNKQQMVIGNNKLTFIIRTTKESFAIDADGAIRWYSTLYVQHMLQPIHNGHLLLLSKKTQSALVYNDLLETDYLGRVYKEYNFSAKTSNSDGGNETTVLHHDIIELPNHDLVATANDGSDYVEDTMIVISHKTGKVTKVIDLKRLLPKAMYLKYKAGSNGDVDWFHQNAVYYDKNDQSLMISGRNQDMIMKLDLQTTKIKWIYSGKKKATWPKKYRSLLLTPTKGTTITGGQHGLNLLGDVKHDPTSENILLYDNNINVTNGNAKTSGKYSQGVQYHIDTKKMTIKQTWAYGKALGAANFTAIIGYTQKLNRTNYLLDFGFKNKGKESNVIEVNGQQQVFNVTFLIMY
ncbi:aryl-sulfate sulfotransferase [Loigolactobacillus binensis]|uniref:Aryl-sulfate sulfotransferase n=1 Tax=Loigolactobacillus binensis TaxID=2559922 RepID=A0ABW3EB23_9LACO|nr:aryl-sulfate sulfotransferase [Loigolactobacillus binensis]